MPAYEYEEQFRRLMNKDGVHKILLTKEKVDQVFSRSSACLVKDLLVSGDTWEALAAIDFLAEKEYITIHPRVGWITQAQFVTKFGK